MDELRYHVARLSPKFKCLKVFTFADLHIGNPQFSEKSLDEDIYSCRHTPNSIALGVGDWFESVTRTSKGDVWSLDIKPKDIKGFLRDKFAPIKGKFKGMVGGNHEDRLYYLTGVDPLEELAQEWGCPYRSEGMMLKVIFGANNEGHEDRPYSYFIYFTHGYGGARTKSAKAVKVERLGAWIHADLYIMAHDHVVNVAPDVYLMPDNRTSVGADGRETGLLKKHKKMLVKASAYLKWGGYAEKGGFPPVDLDPVRIKLGGEGKPKVTVEV